MVIVHASKEIMAPLEKVWDIVSDIDREPEFWHGTKSVKNVKKDGNVVEREVVIAFRNSLCKEIVTIDPKKKVNIKIIDGPMRGTKNIIVNSAENNNKTIIDVEWNIKLSGFFGMFTGMVKKHILEGTEEALERISKTVL